MFMYEAAVSYLEKLLVNLLQTTAVQFCFGKNVQRNQAAHI
jgi:hypothetical protein